MAWGSVFTGEMLRISSFLIFLVVCGVLDVVPLDVSEVFTGGTMAAGPSCICPEVVTVILLLVPVPAPALVVLAPCEPPLVVFVDFAPALLDAAALVADSLLFGEYKSSTWWQISVQNNSKIRNQIFILILGREES